MLDSGGGELGKFGRLVCHLRCCGTIVWGVPLVGGVLRLEWIGVLELVECFLEISWHGDVHYDGLVVPVQCDATIKTPCQILCYLIFLLECI